MNVQIYPIEYFMDPFLPSLKVNFLISLALNLFYHHTMNVLIFHLIFEA